MSDRSYIGIDNNDKNEWMVALWGHGKISFSRPFKNTPTELTALVRFITESCVNPKICLKPDNVTALKLIKFVGSIPNVEVMLMSDAGLRLHSAWFIKSTAKSGSLDNSCQAPLLAFCAERMV